MSRVRGIEWPDTIPEWLNVVRVLLVEYHGSGMGSVPEVLAWFDDLHRWGTPMRPDEKLWAMTQEQERAALGRSRTGG